MAGAGLVARTVLEEVASLQSSDGHWELNDALATTLGLQLADLEGVETHLPQGASWRSVVATTLARLTAERAASIVAGEASGGVAPTFSQRREALKIGEARSPLGAKMSEMAEGFLERAWAAGGTVGSIKEMKALKASMAKLESVVGAVVDQSMPKPDWKKATYASSRAPVQQAFSKGPERVTLSDLIRTWRELPAVPIAAGRFRWEDAQATLHMSGGSGGATLVRFPSGVLCVKPQKLGAAGELCATVLANFLNIRAAAIRVLSFESEEGRQAAMAMRKKEPALPEHVEYVRQLLPQAGREFLGVLEFVPGVGLQGVEARDVLLALPSEKLRRVWREVGRLTALDALMNNLDRVPLLWDNDGNTANVMLGTLTAEAPEVVGIDQAVVSINAGPGRDRYLERLSQLASCAKAGRWDQVGVATAAQWLPTTGLRQSQECLESSCGVASDPEALLEGLGEVFTHIAAASDDGSLRQALAGAAAEARRVFETATARVGLTELESMEEFVSVTGATIAEAMSPKGK